jgi:hypothetical protein
LRGPWPDQPRPLIPPHRWIEQLFAERRGVDGRWQKVSTSVRNEALDLMVMTHVMAHLHASENHRPPGLWPRLRRGDNPLGNRSKNPDQWLTCRQDDAIDCSSGNSRLYVIGSFCAISVVQSTHFRTITAMQSLRFAANSTTAFFTGGYK